MEEKDEEQERERRRRKMQDEDEEEERERERRRRRLQDEEEEEEYRLRRLRRQREMQEEEEAHRMRLSQLRIMDQGVPGHYRVVHPSPLDTPRFHYPPQRPVSQVQATMTDIRALEVNPRPPMGSINYAIRPVPNPDTMTINVAPRNERGGHIHSGRDLQMLNHNHDGRSGGDHLLRTVTSNTGSSRTHDRPANNLHYSDDNYASYGSAGTRYTSTLPRTQHASQNFDTFSSSTYGNAQPRIKVEEDDHDTDHGTEQTIRGKRNNQRKKGRN